MRVRSSSCSVRSSTAARRSAADGPSSRRATAVSAAPPPATSAYSATSGSGASSPNSQSGGPDTTGRSSVSCPTVRAARAYAVTGSQRVPNATTPPNSVRNSSHSTVRQRSRHAVAGRVAKSGSVSSGVSSSLACITSASRTRDSSPSGTSTSSGTQGSPGAIHSHTLTPAIGTHMCNSRVYVLPRTSGRSSRTIPSSCHPAPTAGSPHGEEQPARGEAPAGARSATLLP